MEPFQGFRDSSCGRLPDDEVIMAERNRMPELPNDPPSLRLVNFFGQIPESLHARTRRQEYFSIAAGYQQRPGQPHRIRLHALGWYFPLPAFTVRFAQC